MPYKTTAVQNKALVLEAFDTLFNKRDYKAAERYWSSNYIQHSAHIAPGRDGLFSLLNAKDQSPNPMLNGNMGCRLLAWLAARTTTLRLGTGEKSDAGG